MSFFSELKRRNVFKVGVAYAVATWLLLQIVDLVLENISAPDWVMQVFMLAMAVGFPIAIIIAWAFEVTPDGVKLQKEVDRSQSITPQTGQQLNRGIIMILIVAVVFLISDRFRDEITEELVETPVTSEKEADSAADDTTNPTDTDKSIAVLPFVNMSSDPEQEYFADGISEELLNALAKVSDLKVAGRTSSFAFKGKNEDLLAIGKVLRVSHILEGSVRKSGNRIRITAQLIKVDDGFHMWSETYDRELTDIFTIQDEISTAILAQLKIQLLGAQQTTVQTDTRAYELYLLAKQRIYERNQLSLEMAVDLLSEATSIDPEFAPAFAQLGIATLLLSEYHYGDIPELEAGKSGTRYLEKALLLAPQNAEALAGMGLYYNSFELDNRKGDDTLRKALGINPNMIDARTWFNNNLEVHGKLRESVRFREESFERDPLHGPTFGNLQQAYSKMGQHEKALEIIEDLRPYMPGDPSIPVNLGEAYIMYGELASAYENLRAGYELEPLNAVTRVWYSFSLEQVRDYETMLEVALDFRATLALSRLNRTEEAFILGSKAISKGQNPEFYFQALTENGLYAKLVGELESRWPTLEAYSDDQPGGSGYGYADMAYIAQAYREIGNQEKFDDAMSRLKAANHAQLAEGADNFVLTLSQAMYSILSNDHETAITLLEKSFQQGLYFDTQAKSVYPVFKPLDGEPRYEAAKAAMQKRWEAEMAKVRIMQARDS